MNRDVRRAVADDERRLSRRRAIIFTRPPATRGVTCAGRGLDLGARLEEDLDDRDPVSDWLSVCSMSLNPSS